MEVINFETYLLKRGHTKQTVKSYVFSITPFLEMYLNLKTFTFREVVQALEEQLKRQSNQNYKNSILSALKKFYDYLIETGQRNDHPCRTIRFKAFRKNGVIHTDLFSSSELELLMEQDIGMNCLKERNKLLISLLIYQGIQPQELTNLKVRHVDLDKGRIYIKESKSGARRHLDLHPKQYRLIENYINGSRKELLKTESDILLVSGRGTSISVDNVHYIVSTYKGLFPDRNLNPENIRQSVVANWINEKRFPLEQVQLMAGHRWISTTERYIQTVDVEKRTIINRLHPLA